MVEVTDSDILAAGECFDFIDAAEQADAVARVAPILAAHRQAGVQQGLDMARDEQRATPTTAACCLIGPWGPAEDKSAISKLGGDDASNAK